MPAINQETQTALFPAGLAESEAEVGAWGSWGFMGGPGQGGSAGHLCTCLPKAAQSKNSNRKVKPQICQEELGRFGSWVQGRVRQRCCRCSFAICSSV